MTNSPGSKESLTQLMVYHLSGWFLMNIAGMSYNTKELSFLSCLDLFGLLNHHCIFLTLQGGSKKPKI